MGTSLDGIDTVGIDWALGSQNLMIIHQNVIESFNKSCELVRRERNGSDPVWVDWAWGSHNCEGGATISSLFHHQWSPSPLFLYLILNWLPRLPPRCHLGATLPQLGPQDCLVARPQMDSGSIKGQLQSDAWDPGRLDSASSSRAFKMIKGTADQGVECFGWNGYFNKPHKNC